MNSLPVEVEPTLIHKGATRSKGYLAKNRLGKVPLLEDGDLLLPESGAILTYLVGKFPNVSEHWLPRSDLKQRALVEASMHWYHSNIRAGVARLVFNKVIAARLGLQGNDEVAEDGLKTLHLSLALLGKYWLQGGQRRFMVGGGAPGLGDLLCCCEIEQLAMLDKATHGVDMQGILQDYPLVREWMARVAAACEPHYSEAHATIKRLAAGHGRPNVSSKL